MPSASRLEEMRSQIAGRNTMQASRIALFDIRANRRLRRIGSRSWSCMLARRRKQPLALRWHGEAELSGACICAAGSCWSR
jgi:hypothetical protein